MWSELGRSLGVSALAALLIVLVALPMAVLTVRYRSRVGQAAETVAWTVYALPHITVGLAVLLTGVSLLLPLYQIVAALVVRIFDDVPARKPSVPPRSLSARFRRAWRRRAVLWAGHRSPLRSR